MMFKKALIPRAVSHAAVVMVAVSLATGCADEDSSYTVVNTVRTPVLQFLQRPDSSQSNEARRGCISLKTGNEGAEETWCQQFPLRPGKQAYIRFVLLAPASQTPLVLKITELSKLLNSSLAVPAARFRGGPAGPTTRSLDFAALELTEQLSLAKVSSVAPLRFEERFYSIKIPDVEALLSDFRETADLPFFNLSYETSAAGLRTDRGFVSFVALPAPGSPALESLLSGVVNGVVPDASQREALIQAATTNTPPVFESFFPDGGDVRAQAENSFEVTLAADADPDAKSRVQWFVSSGEVSNPVSRRIKWNPKNAGSVAAFVMVRDLQGGSDFAFRAFEAR